METWFMMWLVSIVIAGHFGKNNPSPPIVDMRPVYTEPEYACKWKFELCADEGKKLCGVRLKQCLEDK